MDGAAPKRKTLTQLRKPWLRYGFAFRPSYAPSLFALPPPRNLIVLSEPPQTSSSAPAVEPENA
jgi:hypothetical protein